MSSSLADEIQNVRAQVAGFDSDIDSQDLPSQLLSLAAARYQSDTKDRKWLAIWAAGLVTAWLTAVIFLLFFNWAIELSEAVLVTLLGTTTINVLGLIYIVLRGHFKK